MRDRVNLQNRKYENGQKVVYVGNAECMKDWKKTLFEVQGYHHPSAQYCVRSREGVRLLLREEELAPAEDIT